MTFNYKNTARRAYQVPDCDSCAIAGAIICDSLSDASTEDWVYDDDGSNI